MLKLHKLSHWHSLAVCTTQLWNSSTPKIAFFLYLCFYFYFPASAETPCSSCYRFSLIIIADLSSNTGMGNRKRLFFWSYSTKNVPWVLNPLIHMGFSMHNWCGTNFRVKVSETRFSLILIADLSTNIGMRHQKKIFFCSYSEKK